MLKEAAAQPVALRSGVATHGDRKRRHHSAHGLARLGLAELPKLDGIDRAGRRFRRWPSGRGGGLLHVVLTDLGRAVVEVYARELETGKPIRWAKLRRHLERQQLRDA